MPTTVRVSDSGIVYASIPIGGGIRRITVMPGEPLDGYPQEVVDAAAEAWTPEVVQAFLDALPQDEQAVPPDAISARQVRLWLVRQGIPISDVTDALDAIEDTQARQEAQIEWEYSPYIERSHPMVQAIATSLSIDIDAAFAEASLL